MENNILSEILKKIYTAIDAGIEKNIQGIELLGFVDQEVRPYLLEHHSTVDGLNALWKEIKMPIFANMSAGQDAKTAFRNLATQVSPEQEQRFRGYIFSQ